MDNRAVQADYIVEPKDNSGVVYDEPKQAPTNLIYVDTDDGVKGLDTETKRLYDIEVNDSDELYEVETKTYTDEKGVKRYTSDDTEVHDVVTFDPDEMVKAQRALEQMQEENGASTLLYDWQRINDLAEKYDTTTEAVKEALRFELGQNERNIMKDLGHENADRIYSTEIGLTDPTLPGSGYMTWRFGDTTNAGDEKATQTLAKPKSTANTASLTTERNQGIKNETHQIDAGNIIDDKSAAAAFAHNLCNAEINHIFHNDFYQYDPVPAWSFAVDFIPCNVSDPLAVKLFSAKTTMTLTKAVLKITANDKTINSQQLNYLGMQHPFFTKMQATHGDLRITFAEDEFFTITNILKDVLKYASFDPSFCTNKVYTTKQGNWGDELVAHAANDEISPQYKQNATDIELDDPNIAKLIHKNKFVFDIVLKIYKAENAHIFSDDLMPPGFVYHYHKCWLKMLDSIDLDYDNDSLIDRTATFSYQYMSSVPYSTYIARHQTSNIVLDEVEIKGDNAAGEQLAAETNASVADDNTHGSRAPAYMTQEGAAQFEKNIANETKAMGSNADQAKAAAMAGEMHKYRR